jgi:hypothetical protein
MNRQMVFEQVKNHLLTQGERASKWEKEPGRDNHREVCLYRSPGGLKCAVGCLIPDSMYYPGMESQSVVRLLQKDPALAAYLEVWCYKDKQFLEELQQIHDNDPPETWLTELIEFSKRNQLKWLGAPQ